MGFVSINHRKSVYVPYANISENLFPVPIHCVLERLRVAPKFSNRKFGNLREQFRVTRAGAPMHLQARMPTLLAGLIRPAWRMRPPPTWTAAHPPRRACVPATRQKSDSGLRVDTGVRQVHSFRGGRERGRLGNLHWEIRGQTHLSRWKPVWSGLFDVLSVRPAVLTCSSKMRLAPSMRAPFMPIRRV